MLNAMRLAVWSGCYEGVAITKDVRLHTRTYGRIAVCRIEAMITEDFQKLKRVMREHGANARSDLPPKG